MLCDKPVVFAGVVLEKQSQVKHDTASRCRGKYCLGVITTTVLLPPSTSLHVHLATGLVESLTKALLRCGVYPGYHLKLMLMDQFCKSAHDIRSALDCCTAFRCDRRQRSVLACSGSSVAMD